MWASWRWRNGGFFLSFNALLTELVFSGKLLRQRHAACKSIDVNPSLMQIQKGPEGRLTDKGSRIL